MQPKNRAPTPTTTRLTVSLQNENGGSPALSVSILELLVLPHHEQEPVVRVTGRVEAIAGRQAEGDLCGGHVRVWVLALEGQAWSACRLLC